MLRRPPAPHPILKSVSLIDTPGVLEAAGDVHARRYDYIKVCRWFIERSDLVFFLFDPTKLDAGIELRMLFKHALRGFENRTRIVLNKADTVGPQEIMRVYGALFWNLSNLIATTEPPRVYVSSFWDKPYKPGTNHQLFTDEKCDLIYDLVEVVPLQSLDKRVTSVLRRAQDVFHHVLVCATVRSKMPRFFGKDKAKKAALDALPETYSDLAAKYKLSVHVWRARGLRGLLRQDEPVREPARRPAGQAGRQRVSPPPRLPPGDHGGRLAHAAVAAQRDGAGLSFKGDSEFVSSGRQSSNVKCRLSYG